MWASTQTYCRFNSLSPTFEFSLGVMLWLLSMPGPATFYIPSPRSVPAQRLVCPLLKQVQIKNHFGIIARQIRQNHGLGGSLKQSALPWNACLCNPTCSLVRGLAASWNTMMDNAGPLNSPLCPEYSTNSECHMEENTRVGVEPLGQTYQRLRLVPYTAEVGDGGNVSPCNLLSRELLIEASLWNDR